MRFPAPSEVFLLPKLDFNDESATMWALFGAYVLVRIKWRSFPLGRGSGDVSIVRELSRGLGRNVPLWARGN